jgi:hypothetical protein
MVHGGIEGFNGCMDRNLEADKNTYTQSDQWLRVILSLLSRRCRRVRF